MLPYTVLLLFIFFDRVNSQVGVTFPSTDAVAGDDARLECAFNLETRTYSASFLIQSDVDGNQGDTLVSSSSTSAPGSKYRVEEDLTSNRVFFVITNTTRSDEGFYLCLIQNSGFDVYSTSPAKLTVQYIEKPVLSPFPTPVTKGDTVNMSCSAEAVPSAMYTFLMDGEVQQPEGSSTFLIQPASRDNDGSYQCSARNNAGTKTSESRTLVVHYKPECHHPDYMYADLGKDFTVASNCSANPTDMKYQWSSVPNVTDLDNNPATFTFLVSTKVGTNYTVTVIANNSIGSTTESVIVIVAVIENCTININPNPAKKGESVDIECSSKNSYPIPMITLFKEEKEYKNVSGTKLTYNIESMKKSDKGEYYCIATNIAGNRTSEKMKLDMKPDTVKIIAIIFMAVGFFLGLVGGIIFFCVDVLDNRKRAALASIVIGIFHLVTGLLLYLILWIIVIIVIAILVALGVGIAALIYLICCGCWSSLSPCSKCTYVVLCILGLGIIVLILEWKRRNKPNDTTSDPVCPQDDVEMKQPGENSEIKRYAAGGGELYTEVNLKDKKKKPDSDNESSKPTAVDKNVEGLQYADLDLPDKKNVIHRSDQETTYFSIQPQPRQI